MVDIKKEVESLLVTRRLLSGEGSGVMRMEGIVYHFVKHWGREEGVDTEELKVEFSEFFPEGILLNLDELGFFPERLNFMVKSLEVYN